MIVLFDIDGTLIDQRRAEALAAAEFLAAYGNLLPEICDVERFCTLWRAARERHLPPFFAGRITYREYHRRRIRELFQANGDLPDAEADARFARFLTPYRRAWRLFAEVPATLECMRGHRLAVLSNGHGPLQRAKLRATGILNRFTDVLISDELGAAKPEARAFAAACRRLGAPPRDCLCVGDRLEGDVQAACAAGLRGVWLNRNSATAANVEMIGSLAELPKLLKSARETGQAKSSGSAAAGELSSNSRQSGKEAQGRSP